MKKFLKQVLIALYIVIQKSGKKSQNKKNIKITKRAHAFKGYVSYYNVEILNTFNPELQLKNNEFVIKNELKKLLTELRGYKFATTSVLVSKKVMMK